MSLALVPRCSSGCCRRSLALMSRPLATARNEAIKSYDEIPGPKPLPLIGNAYQFVPFIGELGGMQFDDMHKYLHNTYGPIVRMNKIPGRSDLVFCYRPEDVETVFRNEGPWPHRETLQGIDHFRSVLRKDFYEGGGSILTENGQQWGESRSKVNQPMMQPRISRKYVPPIADVAHEFVDIMRNIRDEKEELPANFNNELYKWALESIAFVALDTRLGCLAPNLAPESEQQRIIDAVNIALDKMFDMEVGPPFWKIIKTPAAKKFFDSLDVFLEVTVKYVQAAIDRYEARRKETPDGDWEPSVLERLLARTDVKTASIMAQDMMFAGIDTTSYSTAITMFTLARNQEKQAILFEELKRVLPKKDTPFNEERLEEMRYLKAVIKESMRVMPIVSANSRNTVKEIVISNYRIPAGVSVVMPNTMYRFSDDVYPQARRFLPERWLKARPDGAERVGSAEDFDAVSHGKHHPFAFLPFGFGPRSCVGKRFAEMEMEILLAKIVRNFKVDYKYGDISFNSRIINTVKDPMKFKLTERIE